MVSYSSLFVRPTRIAAPLVGVVFVGLNGDKLALWPYSLQTISVMFAGHWNTARSIIRFLCLRVEAMSKVT